METVNEKAEIKNINTNLNNILIMNKGKITNNSPDSINDFDNDTLEVHYLLASTIQ